MINSKKKMQLYLLIYLIGSASILVAMEEDSKKNESIKHAPLLFTMIKEKSGLNAIEIIIQLGENVNEEYQYATPIIKAVELGNESLVKLLHAHGALLEQEMGGRRMTPLKAAVDCQNLSMVELVLNLGASVDYADPFYQETALYLAVSKAQLGLWDRKKLLPIIALLVQKGADGKKENCRNLSPLKQAAMTNDTEVIELLTKTVNV